MLIICILIITLFIYLSFSRVETFAKGSNVNKIVAKREKLVEEGEEALKEKAREIMAELQRKAKEKELLNMLQNAYINNIAARIKTFWRYQSAEDDWTAEVYVVQDKDGNVRAVDVKNANVGNSKLAKSFMDSIERAVNKASPLPGAPDEAVFDKELYFIFSVN
jgi:colicin import membrane protein